MSSKEASRSVPSLFFHFPPSLPLLAYPTIFIIKVNDIFCFLALLPRDDDAHTWLKIDVVFFVAQRVIENIFLRPFCLLTYFSGEISMSEVVTPERRIICNRVNESRRLLVSEHLVRKLELNSGQK